MGNIRELAGIARKKISGVLMTANRLWCGRMTGTGMRISMMEAIEGADPLAAQNKQWLMPANFDRFQPGDLESDDDPESDV